MGTCLGKESQRVKNGEKKMKKQRKSSPKGPVEQSASPCAVVDSPAVTVSSCDSVVMASPGHSYSSDTSVDDPPAAETFSMEYSHLERKNSAANLIRVSSSEGKMRIRSELQSPAESTEEHVEVACSPRSDKRSRSPLKRMFTSPKLAPRVLFKSTHFPNKHLSSLRREKNNSTSSMYISDTINAPNVDEVIKCMAIALQYHIKNGMEHPEYIDRVFSEKYHPLTRELLDLVRLPEIHTIYRYINMIFQVQRLHTECAILCLAYIERILSSNPVVLHPENWRRLVFGSILIATKVWEDESVWNVDFLDLFPLLTLVDLNNLENRFMELLQFNVLIVGSEYAKYYFELRALSQQESFPLQPLNKETQLRLEERSQKTNEQMVRISNSVFRGVAPKRARSVDNFELKSPPAVLA